MVPDRRDKVTIDVSLINRNDMLKLERIKGSSADLSTFEVLFLLTSINIQSSFRDIFKRMQTSYSSSRQRYVWPVYALLITLCLPAYARWEPMGLYPVGMFYIDTTSVVREGDFRKLISALDYRETQSGTGGKKYLSTRSQLHIDCKQELVRTLHLTIFAGPMLSGAVVENGGILKEWQLIPAETPMHKIWYRVC